MKPKAPANWIGYQEGVGHITGFHLFNLTADIEGHPKNSTVTQAKLERLGFEVELPSEAEQLRIKHQRQQEFARDIGNAKPPLRVVMGKSSHGETRQAMDMAGLAMDDFSGAVERAMQSTAALRRTLSQMSPQTEEALRALGLDPKEFYIVSYGEQLQLHPLKLRQREDYAFRMMLLLPALAATVVAFVLWLQWSDAGLRFINALWPL